MVRTPGPQPWPTPVDSWVGMLTPRGILHTSIVVIKTLHTSIVAIKTLPMVPKGMPIKPKVGLSTLVLA